ncbi:serine hydrolase [Corallococcus exercitus]|uniref:Serine hydrolase n=1 Tax=Corallococcus exercitus TaxID=2316736 RepID=A0A7Y4KRE0_9BACT|nr:serine hydrolase [Corallococcus exercitus]NOK38443.1 serine hydrolase [Corallococcus exercitus]
MRRSLLLVLMCSLLGACAHAPDDRPAESSLLKQWEPSPEIRQRLIDAEQALQGGNFAKALALYEGTWASGYHDPFVAYGAASAASRAGDAAKGLAWMRHSSNAGLSDVGGLRKDPSLSALRAQPAFEAIVTRVQENARRIRAEGHVGSELPASTPEAEGLSADALAALLKAAEESGTSGLVLLRHGRLVGEWYFGGDTRRIETMSATKGVVALAIGLLIDEGRIASADAPVSTFFPEWKQGRKAQVTLRHLLNHTSGLEAQRTAMDIYRSPDFVRYALEAEVVDAPGSRFFYNNKAVNLLAGVVERASGEKLDAYLRRRLFAPLGIRDVAWQKDPAGNPLGMSGLRMHPLDFAKLGQLLLQRGQWQGRRILSEAWIRECTTPSVPALSPTGGLLWWSLYEKAVKVIEPEMLERAKAQGLSEELVTRLRPWVGRPLAKEDFLTGLVPALGGMAPFMEFVQKAAPLEPRSQVAGALQGYAALGSLGQFLVVIPGAELVAVRLAEPDGSVPEERMEFSNFPSLVTNLVRP